MFAQRLPRAGRTLDSRTIAIGISLRIAAPSRKLWDSSIPLTSRMATQPATKAYVQRHTEEGPSTPGIIRWLKRYVAREVFSALPQEVLVTVEASRRGASLESA